jgi:hypothetical protein
VLLGREVVEESPFADIGGFRDVFHGGMAKSAGAEELDRGAYDSLANLKFPAIAAVGRGRSLGRE